MSVSMPHDRALLFDLDGTLADTWEVNYLSYRDSLAESGISCTRDAFAPCYGGHWHEFLPRLAVGCNVTQLQRVHRRKQELYPQHIASTRANLPLISLLRMARFVWPIGLVTTASRDSTDLLLTHLGLVDAFDCIVTGDDVQRAKPDPEGYRHCLSGLRADATGSLAFEDSPNGIAAARMAGLQVLTVSGFARNAVSS
jgi:beta-phosphoglucomutase